MNEQSTLRCARCEAAFTAKRSKRTKRFCSKRCRDMARGERRRRAEGKPVDNVVRRCRCCLRSFESRRWNQVYCGPKCRDHVLHKRMNRKRRKTDREFIPSSDYIARMTEGIRSTWKHAERTSRHADADELAASIIESRKQGGDDE